MNREANMSGADRQLKNPQTRRTRTHKTKRENGDYI
jgi:hypothetical protein